MPRRMLVFALVCATLAAQPSRKVRAWFPDGTGLEIYTESTGPTNLDRSGSIGIGPGPAAADLVNRAVVDGQNHVLFIYNLEASRGSSPGTVSIKIEPISPVMEANIVNDKSPLKALGPHLPTVGGVREFRSVRIGEAVTLDILSNPLTGERIYDVLRPITDPSPGGSLTVTGGKPREQISLKQISIRVNGQAVQAPGAWLIGEAVRIDLPGQGAFVIATEDPKLPSFQPTARADGKSLSWTLDGQYVEITSATDVLTPVQNAALWIFHDAQVRPDTVRLQAADSADWLLPKR